MNHTPRDRIGITLTVRLGLALHRFGASANRLEDSLQRTAAWFGLQAQFFGLPTSLHAAFGEPGEPQQMVLARVAPGDEDLERLELTDRLIQDLTAGRIAATDALARLAAIVSAPDRWRPVATVIAFALASAAAARFFGGGAREVIAGAGIGLATGLLSRLPRRVPRFGQVFEATAAFLAVWIASAFAMLWPTAREIATLAGVIVLVPGLMLTTAMAEVATGHLASGTSRLTAAFVRFLALAFGTALGQRIADTAFGPITTVTPLPLPDATLWIAMLGAPLAFMVLLRAAPRHAAWIVLFGAVAFAGARAGTAWLGPELGTMAGAVVVGAGSNLYARRLHRPASLVQVPALLMLVPGSLGYRSFASLVEHDVVQGMQSAFTTVLVAMALVVGLLVANVVVPPRGAL